MVVVFYLEGVYQVRNNLKPYQELLIGLTIWIIGATVIQSYVSIVLGDIMVILGSVIVLFAIIHSIIRLFSKKPLKLVKQTCATMLSSYELLKKHHPTAKKEVIYEKLLEARYQDGLTAMKLMSRAENNIGPAYFGTYNLRAITLAAILNETGLRKSHFDENSKDTKLINDTVREVERLIPGTL